MRTSRRLRGSLYVLTTFLALGTAAVRSGNRPTSVQLLGFDVRDWAEQGKR